MGRCACLEGRQAGRQAESQDYEGEEGLLFSDSVI